MNNKIIELKLEDKEKELTHFLKQAKEIYNLRNNCFGDNLFIHLNLLMAELSVKILTIFYLSKYEKSHEFKEDCLFKELKNKKKDFSDEQIMEYNKYIKNYYIKSRYNQSNLFGLKGSIENCCLNIFNSMWYDQKINEFIRQNGEIIGITDFNSLDKIFKK